MSVLLETLAGPIVVDVDYSPAGYNFLKLAVANYFFFAPFYGVQKDVAAVSGDPEHPEGHGRASSDLGDVPQEYGINKNGYLRVPDGFLTTSQSTDQTEKDSALGVVFFVTRGDNAVADPTIGSTFLISLTPDWDMLRPMKNLIRAGKVSEGFQALEAINNSALDDSGRPLVDVRITHIHILDDPFPELDARKTPSKVSASQLRNLRVGNADSIPSGNSPNNRDEHNQSLQSSSTSAAIALELLGDLPRFDAQPSPQTLFVAKLNPITDSRSLAALFLRFGTVRGVSLVAGKSYGFVEFATVAEADSAYAGLQEVVVDGRRLVVDYSQSTKRSR